MSLREWIDGNSRPKLFTDFLIVWSSMKLFKEMSLSGDCRPYQWCKLTNRCLNGEFLLIFIEFLRWDYIRRMMAKFWVCVEKKKNKVHAWRLVFFSNQFDMVKIVVLAVRWGYLTLLRFAFLFWKIIVWMIARFS